jgi:hypothetical protein
MVTDKKKQAVFYATRGSGPAKRVGIVRHRFGRAACSVLSQSGGMVAPIVTFRFAMQASLERILNITRTAWCLAGRREQPSPARVSAARMRQMRSELLGDVALQAQIWVLRRQGFGSH